MRFSLCLAVLLACAGVRAQDSSADPVAAALRAALQPEQQAALPESSALEPLAAAVTPQEKPKALSALHALEEKADAALLMRLAKAYDLLRAPQDIKRIAVRLQQQAPQDPKGAQLASYADAVILLTKDKTAPHPDLSKLADPWGSRSAAGSPGSSAAEANLPYKLPVKAGPYKSVPEMAQSGSRVPDNWPLKALGFGASLSAAAYAFLTAREREFASASAGAKTAVIVVGVAGLAGALAIGGVVFAPAGVGASVTAAETSLTLSLKPLADFGASVFLGKAAYDSLSLAKPSHREGDLPSRGAPNSTGVRDDGKGGGQIREYGPDGRAKTDYDFGHDHGNGDPHAHDWDWSNDDKPRGPGRPLKPGE